MANFKGSGCMVNSVVGLVLPFKTMNNGVAVVVAVVVMLVDKLAAVDELVMLLMIVAVVDVEVVAARAEVLATKY